MLKGLQRVGLLLLCLGVSAVADEGMWLFNQVPKARIKAKYGFEPSQAWLDHLRESSVRMGDSGSFVSSNGLILTNHHVGRRCVIANSEKTGDLMKAGFYAQSQSEELKCKGLDVEVLLGIEDITPKVLAVAPANVTTVAAANARRAVMDRVTRECARNGLSCEVISLYGGAIYDVYKYKKYSDVRLVFAPEEDSAFFGGDPDNYTFPRYDLDICFFRAYENGQPVHSSNYLKFSRAGAREGDLVFASGNPASTERMTTLAQMELLRDVVYPKQIKSYKRQAALLQQFSERSPENARMIAPVLWDLENRLKAIEGYQAGLLDKDAWARKAGEEKKIRAAVAADAKLRAIYGDPWGEIQRAVAVQKKLDFEKICPESVGLNGRLATFARTLVRAAAERRKPSAERLPEFRDTSWQVQERELLNALPINKDLEEITLLDSLSQLVDDLGPNDSVVRKVLGSQSPAVRAHELISQTRLDDVTVRKQLLEGGQAAIDASTDPLIVLQRAVDAEARLARSRRAGRPSDLGLTGIRVAIAEATFARTGITKAPDATGSLRLSFGVLKGEDGTPAFTTMGEAFVYADRKGDKPPYELPESWRDSKNQIHPDTPLNFISTVDVIGGSSGSPLVNTDGYLVGVVFDANQAMLAGKYVFHEKDSRAMVVDSRAILEALRNIYKATALADEITNTDARPR